MQETLSFFVDFVQKHENEFNKYSSTSIQYNPILKQLVKEFPSLQQPPIHCNCATILNKMQSSLSSLSIYKIFLNYNYHYIVTSVETEYKAFDTIDFDITNIFPFYSKIKTTNIPLLLQITNMKQSSQVSDIKKCKMCDLIALKDELYCNKHKYQKLQQHLSNRMELQGMNFFKTQYEEDKSTTTTTADEIVWYFVNQKWTRIFSAATATATAAEVVKKQQVSKKRKRIEHYQHPYLQEQQRIDTEEYLKKINRAKLKKLKMENATTVDET